MFKWGAVQLPCMHTLCSFCYVKLPEALCPFCRHEICTSGWVDRFEFIAGGVMYRLLLNGISPPQLITQTFEIVNAHFPNAYTIIGMLEFIVV